MVLPAVWYTVLTARYCWRMGGMHGATAPLHMHVVTSQRLLYAHAVNVTAVRKAMHGHSSYRCAYADNVSTGINACCSMHGHRR